MILLIRHALAVPRVACNGPDDARPLTPQGVRQADALVPLLGDEPIAAVVSSPTQRCVATVEPIATARGVDITTSPALREECSEQALELLLDAVDHTVLCTHGDVVGSLLVELRQRGWPLPPKLPKAKGSVWLLDRSSCAYLRPGA